MIKQDIRYVNDASYVSLFVQGERETPLDLAGSLLLHNLSSTLLERLSRDSGPVILGLGHSMSQGVLVLGPILAEIGSTLGVPIGVVLEDTGLGDISLVVL